MDFPFVGGAYTEPVYASNSQVGYDNYRHGWWRRNATFEPIGSDNPSYKHEYPQPIGPVRSDTKYAFVAIPYETEQELQALIDAGELDFPDCDANSTLEASFSVESTPAEEGDVVYFTDLSTGNGNSIVSWTWRFGDGAESHDQNPSHRYPDNGDYTVELEITDAQGRSNSSSQIVEVTNLPPNVEMDDVTIDFGQVANLVLRLSDPSEVDTPSLTGFISCRRKPGRVG